MVGNNMQQFRNSILPVRQCRTRQGKPPIELITAVCWRMNRWRVHQADLLLRRFGWHEPHVGSGSHLANCLCVSRINLLPLDAGRHVSWRHQPNDMAEGLTFA
jgi:hypothetical protein